MRPRLISEEEFTGMQARVKMGQAKTGWLPAANARNRVRKAGPAGVGADSPFAPFQLALIGQLPSGKNQVQLLFRNGKVRKYPNKTFTNWRAASLAQITPEFFRAPNIAQPVRLTIDYWPGDKRTRDVSGQLDALFHLLVYAKVLKDDGLVWNVVWRRHEVNKQFPKVIMGIESLREVV